MPGRAGSASEPRSSSRLERRNAGALALRGAGGPPGAPRPGRPRRWLRGWRRRDDRRPRACGRTSSTSWARHPAIVAASSSSRVAASVSSRRASTSSGLREPAPEERPGLARPRGRRCGRRRPGSSDRAATSCTSWSDEVLGDGLLEGRPAAEVGRRAALGEPGLPVDAAVGQPLEPVPGEHDDGGVEDLAPAGGLRCGQRTSSGERRHYRRACRRGRLRRSLYKRRESTNVERTLP